MRRALSTARVRTASARAASLVVGTGAGAPAAYGSGSGTAGRRGRRRRRSLPGAETPTTTGTSSAGRIVVDRSIGRISIGLARQPVVRLLGRPDSAAGGGSTVAVGSRNSFEPLLDPELARSLRTGRRRICAEVSVQLGHDEVQRRASEMIGTVTGRTDAATHPKRTHRGGRARTGSSSHANCSRLVARFSEAILECPRQESNLCTRFRIAAVLAASRSSKVGRFPEQVRISQRSRQVATRSATRSDRRPALADRRRHSESTGVVVVTAAVKAGVPCRRWHRRKC